MESLHKHKEFQALPEHLYVGVEVEDSADLQLRTASSPWS